MIAYYNETKKIHFCLIMELQILLCLLWLTEATRDTGGTQFSTAIHSHFLIRSLEMADSTTNLAGNLPHAGKGLQGNSQDWVKDARKIINISLSVP